MRIPDDLQAVAGKQLYSKPLGTKDAAEAMRVWPAAMAEYEAQVAAWRCAANRVALTPDGAADLAVKWGVAIATSAIPFVMDRPEKFDISGPGGRFSSDADRARFEARRGFHANEALRLAGISVTPEGWTALIEAMTNPVLAAYLEADLRAAGVSAAGGSPAFSPFTHALEKHGLIVRADQPEPEPPPGAAPMAPSIVPIQSTPPVSVDALLATWRKITAAKPRTIEATGYAVRDFKKFLGHGDAGRVTKADGLR